MDFGGRIRNLRKEKGIKATELSEKVQISQPYLSQIEHGTKQPPIDVIVNVCKVLNIPLSQFFAEDQENLSISYLLGKTDQGNRCPNTTIDPETKVY